MPAVYFDNNATTRTDPAVVDAMLPYFSEHFGNAASAHAFGTGVADAVKQARASVQALLGAAHDHEIIFTSGGSESDNAAILSALENDEGRNELVISSVEHPAMLSLAAHLEKSRGVKIHRIGVDSAGRLDIDAFERALGPRTALASVMWANNETGTLFPVAALAEAARRAGALFHTDAVQAAGKIPIDLGPSAIDMLSLSGHKLHGPKGIGVLYVRKGVKFRPLVRGGHQERGRRGGTLNVPGIVGLGKAVELALADLAGNAGRVRALRDRLEAGILAIGGPCAINGDRERRLPNTLNVAFDALDGEAILVNLDKAGIAASTGSACAAGANEPSHVLRAMGLAPTLLHGVIRLSLSRESTDAEIDYFLEVLPGILAHQRALSPLWRERHGVREAS